MNIIWFNLIKIYIWIYETLEIIEKSQKKESKRS